MTTLGDISAFTWAFPEMAWLIGAAALPIIAHWNLGGPAPSRDFPSIRLLSSADMGLLKSMGPRLFDVALLLLRLLIVALIVVAAMMPMGRWNLPPAADVGDDGVDLFIVLDASASTRSTVGGTQCLSSLKALAERRIQALHLGTDHAGVIIARRAPAVLGDGIESDLQKIESELASVSATEEFADVPQAVRLAADRLSIRPGHRRGRIVVASDLQASSWISTVKVDESIEVEVLAGPAMPPNEACGLNPPLVTPGFPSVGDEIQVSSTVRPGLTERPVTVEFQIDGKSLGKQLVAFDGAKESLATINLKLDPAWTGFHEIQVIADDGARGYGAFTVGESAGVAILGGDATDKPISKDADVKALSAALWPWRNAKGPADSAAALPGALEGPVTPARLAGIQVMIVPGHRTLTDQEIRVILKRLADGTGLVVVGPGPAARRIEELTPRTFSPWFSWNGVERIGEWDGGHQNLVVADPESGFVRAIGPGLALALSRVKLADVTSHYVQKNLDWNGTPVLTADSTWGPRGIPILAFSTLGRGKASFFNVSPRQLALAMGPAYCPLMNLIVDQVSPRLATSGFVGEPMEFTVPEGSAANLDSYSVRGPDGARVPSLIELDISGAKIIVDAAPKAGVYRLQQGDRTLGGVGVNIDPREQSPSTLSREAAMTRLRTGDPAGARVGGIEFGRRLKVVAWWRYALCAVFALFAVESFFALIGIDAVRRRSIKGPMGVFERMKARGLALHFLRCGTLILLLGLTLRPKEWNVGLPDAATANTSEVVVAVDRSGSMKLNEFHMRYHTRSREFVGDEIAEAFENARLGRVVSIGSETESNLAQDLRGVIGGMRPGQLLVVSDGRDTRGDRLDSVASMARAAGVRVHTVTVGVPQSSQDTAIYASGPARDRGIGAGLIMVGEETSVRVVMTQHGYLGAGAVLTLTTTRADPASLNKSGERRTLPVVFDGEGPVIKEVPLRFDAPGVYLCECSLSGQEGESNLENNRAAFVVHVIARPIRVLRLEGSPGWDTKFIAEALRSDPRIELKQIVRIARESSMDSPVVGVSGVPTTIEEWGRYDVVVLGRGMESMLPGSSPSTLVNYVDQGGKVILARGAIADQNSESGRKLYAAMPWARLFGDDAPMELGWRLELSNQGKSFAPFTSTPGFATAMGATDLSKDRQELAGAAGAVWGGLSGQSKTLLYATPPESNHKIDLSLGTRPAWVVESWGPGRGKVVGVNVEGLWRLKMGRSQEDGTGPVFDSLWSNLVRWMALDEGFEARGGPHVRVWPEQTVKGRTVAVEVTGAGESPSVTVVGGGAVVPIKMESRDGGWRGTLTTEKAGVYSVMVRGSDGAAGDAAWLAVESDDVELRDTRVDRQAMAQLAKATGGNAVFGWPGDDTTKEETTAEQLKRMVTGGLEETVSAAGLDAVDVADGDGRSTVWQIGGLMALFTIEWLLRRRWGLL